MKQVSFKVRLPHMDSNESFNEKDDHIRQTVFLYETYQALNSETQMWDWKHEKFETRFKLFTVTTKLNLLLLTGTESSLL